MNIASASSGNPLPSAASISLALNSVFASGVVLTKNNVMTQASHRSVVGPAISRPAPSQKKSKSPVPVVASSKVQVSGIEILEQEEGQYDDG